MAVLEKQVPNLELIFHWGPFEFNMNRLRLADAVFVQRPCASHHMELVQAAHELGIPTWVDLDDDIFNIPDSNMNHYIYAANNYLSYCAASLTQADVVTVTTQALADSLKKYNANIQVIPNAFDDVLLGKKARKAVWPRKPLILWRGSNTHDADILKVGRSFEHLTKAYPEWRWIFLGHKPWVLTANMPENSYNHMPWQDNLLSYFNCIDKIQPTITIVPLDDCPFNRAKSNIAWIEGSFANSVVLGPDWAEWQKPGVVVYNSPESFAGQLEKLMSGSQALAGCVEDSKGYIHEHLRLTYVNHLRAKVLQSLGMQCPEFDERI